jgi:hypothetical protein
MIKNIEVSSTYYIMLTVFWSVFEDKSCSREWRDPEGWLPTDNILGWPDLRFCQTGLFIAFCTSSSGIKT